MSSQNTILKIAQKLSWDNCLALPEILFLLTHIDSWQLTAFLSKKIYQSTPLADLILTHNVIKNKFFSPSGKGPTPGRV